MIFAALLIKQLRLVKFYLEISKVFDKVWHDDIICKLNRNGIKDGNSKRHEEKSCS